jgi:toxin ParE1/3/4
MPCLLSTKPASIREVFYRQAAEDDIIRQFRYYLVTMSCTGSCSSFPTRRQADRRLAVRTSLMAPCHPLRNPRLQNLRSWPVAGFDAVRIYYLAESGTLRVIRILQQKRDVRRILEWDTAKI